MAASGSGAVFFLGTRAHYQVLQQPEARCDMENGNASTETVYRDGTSVAEPWRSERAEPELDNRQFMVKEKQKAETTSVKRRSYRRASETTLCERDVDMKPAVLNNIGDNNTKRKPPRNRSSLVALLTSLARRKRRMDGDRTQYLRHIESALSTCTYRESCRCLDCQSRYFECDESDEYSSDDSEYTRYVAQQEYDQPQDEDDEVFVDKIPEDNTSTDLLIETKEKMSVSSDEGTEVQGTEEDNLHLEVAAGTPVLLNYLLHHPITCTIQ